MNKIILSLSIFFRLLSAEEFTIIIPSYNNKDRVQENLDSVISQSHKDYRVIYIDDASTDGTADLVQEYIHAHQLEKRIRLVRNMKRIGALANVYQAVWLCNPNEIVVDLDGDDRLATPHVLKDLHNIYQNPDVWLTYGDWMYFPSGERGEAKEVPLSVIDRNDFRSFRRGGTTPLRTFYAGLFHRISKQDLLYQGQFYSVASDLAFMFPMLEMAGRHIRFVPQVHYIYNNETPINDHTLRYKEQQVVDQLLRTQNKYQPVQHYSRSYPSKTIYIYPGQWGELFSIDNPIYNRDNCLDVMYRLRTFAAFFGYDLQQVTTLQGLKNFEYLITFDVPLEQIQFLCEYPQEKLVLFLWEPPSIIPENYNSFYHAYFSKIYTWNDSLIDNQKYFKFYYPRLLPKISEPIDFEDKRLSVMITYNKSSTHPRELFSQRLAVINFFEGLPSGDFDLYGKNWPNTLRNYHGPIEKKIGYMPYYKFNFCYENVSETGYVSEKIFDCFQAGSVPIYIGAPNVVDYVPKNCFVDRRDFASENDVYNYIKNMNFNEYQHYLENIEVYLQTDKALLYSPENFIRIFMNLLMDKE